MTHPSHHATADTLIDHTRSDASSVQTLVRGDAPPLGAAPTTPSEQRSTVLPRVEFEGEAPRLVTDNRRRFDALGVLGTGGVGEVTLAHDNDIRRQVALKRLRPEADDPATVVRFVEEIHTVGQLEHPNIVPIHDVGIDEHGRYYYVMKFVDGETLETVIENLAAGKAEYHQRYPFERREEIFLGVLRAVQYAHAQGIVHRDLKPANIMVGRYGEVLVMDWGIARKIRDPNPRPSFASAPASLPAPSPEDRDALFRTTDGALIGTPAYMSPEQARGARDSIDERSDVYSLCVVFHELLTCRHYLEDRETLPAMIDGVLNSEPPKAHHHVTAVGQSPVPAELLHYVRRGLAKDPAQRFRSVTAMIDMLMNLRAGEIPVQCPVTLMKRSGTVYLRAVDRHPRGMMLAMLLVPAVLVATAVMLMAFAMR